MSNTQDKYTPLAFNLPKSQYQSSPAIARSSSPTPIMVSRNSSYNPHQALGYFDIPSRSAPSSPQTASFPFSPVSRSSSPARRSRELTHSYSGSDFEDSLVGFSLVPNWLKMAMEKDGNVQNKSNGIRPKRYSPLNSPDSIISSSNETTPQTPRTPQLNVTIPKSHDIVSAQKEDITKEEVQNEEEDRRYWEEEDDGYFGEME